MLSELLNPTCRKWIMCFLQPSQVTLVQPVSWEILKAPYNQAADAQRRYIRWYCLRSSDYASLAVQFVSWSKYFHPVFRIYHIYCQGNESLPRHKVGYNSNCKVLVYDPSDQDNCLHTPDTPPILSCDFGMIIVGVHPFPPEKIPDLMTLSTIHGCKTCNLALNMTSPATTPKFYNLVVCTASNNCMNIVMEQHGKHHSITFDNHSIPTW